MYLHHHGVVHRGVELFVDHINLSTLGKITTYLPTSLDPPSSTLSRTVKEPNRPTNLPPYSRPT